jgi:hypothetical protein
MKIDSEIIDKIRRTMRGIARQEATLQLRSLYNQVRINLMHNPHNTFKGTPSEYIRKYGLAKRLKREVYERFCV